MFTSRKSERVALLWGDRWWIEGRTEPVVFGELPRAAEALLAAFGDERPERLRIIHQPPGLAADAIACPKGDRATLQAALGEQFPALFSENRAWSFEPIVGGRDHYATVLYHEQQPALYRLVQALEEAGVTVTGAWPLAHLLNLVPEDWPETGALTVVAAAENEVLIFRHTAEGRREVKSAMNEEGRELARETLRTTLARSDTALYFVALDPAAERLAGELPPLDLPRLRWVGWNRLVAASAALSRRQPAQMLPLSVSFNPGRALSAVSVVLMIVAMGLAGHSGWTEFAQRRQAAANQRLVAELRGEIAQQREAENELVMLRAGVERRAAAKPFFVPLLRSFSARVPAEVVLTTLRANRREVRLSGGVVTPPSEAAWREWLQAIEVGGVWRSTEPAPLPTGAFRLGFSPR